MSNVENIKPRRPTDPDYTVLIAHELANLMPLIEGKPFDELKADLRANGLRVKIMLFQDRILDGRNRYRALKEIGHDFSAENFEVFTGTLADAEAYVISINMLRRQMSNAEKGKVIERMIFKYPDESDRGIARRCGMSSHSFVGTVRERLENPPERKEFERFCKTFDKLDDRFRVEFAKKFSRDLRELLAS
jgi:hypothetical protein